MTPPYPGPVPDLPDRYVCRAIREAARLSRRELAERLGCHEQTVVRWELGLAGVSGPYLIPYLNLLGELDRASRRAATG